MIRPYTAVEVTQKDEEESEKRLVEVAKEYKDTPKSLKENAYLGWENNSLKPDKEPSIRNNFLDPDKKANDFDDEDKETAAPKHSRWESIRFKILEKKDKE